MSEQPNDALYVYGIIRTGGNESSWGCLGLENNQVFILSAGELNILVHKCKAKAYVSEYPEKIKELIVEHNNVLEEAGKGFGNVLPFSFNTIVQGKNGKSAEDDLKEWLKERQDKFKQLLDHVNGKREYGIAFFYDRKKWIDEIRAQASYPIGKTAGINYLLKGKQEYEIKDNLIRKIQRRMQEVHDAIKPKVCEIKIVQPKVRLMNKEEDLLMNISILANEQELNEVKQFLSKNMNQEDYRFIGPFPPYSFVISNEASVDKNG